MHRHMSAQSWAGGGSIADQARGWAAWETVKGDIPHTTPSLFILFGRWNSTPSYLAQAGLEYRLHESPLSCLEPPA
jgi:hypothetical protein